MLDNGTLFGALCVVVCGCVVLPVMGVLGWLILHPEWEPDGPLSKREIEAIEEVLGDGAQIIVGDRSED